MIEIRMDKRQIEGIRDKLKKLSPLDRDSVTYKWMKDFGIEGEKIMRTDILAGQVLHKRTGMLANSFSSRVGMENKTVVLRIGSGVRHGGWAQQGETRYSGQGRLPYAEIHETGGVIRPKKGKYLTIPFPYNQTPAGVTKMSARRMFQQYPDTTFIAKGIIFRKLRKSDKSIQPMFWLKKSVTIPARRYMTIGSEVLATKVAPSLSRTIEKFIGSRN
jgi:phage gpG-like protein